MEKEPNCFHCKHYFVTWDPSRPRGCKFFGFQSKSMPSQMVWQSSGHKCHEYEAKKTQQQDAWKSEKLG